MLVAEALQRLWGLKFEGSEIVDYDWRREEASDGFRSKNELSMRCEGSSENHGVDIADAPRVFDIRTLFDPPPPDQDKLDQFLDWLAELERLEPRLRAQ
jgi:hypothetical protein